MKNYKNLIIISLLLIIAFNSCKVTKLQSFENILKNHIIPVNKAIAMHEEYNVTRYNLLKDKLKSNYQNSDFQDTKFVWFELNDIRNYISYIDAIQKANSSENISGIRVYFAAYPNQNSSHGTTIRHPGKQTLFMVPTFKSKNTLDSRHKNLNHLPFYIERTNDNNPLIGRYKVIDGLMFNYNKRERLEAHFRNTTNSQLNLNTRYALHNSATSDDVLETSTVFNEGEMIPPPNEVE